MSAKRKCSGTTKKGAPCKGSGVLDNGFCMAHQPDEVKESLGFGGPQAGAGRPPLPKPSDIARQLIERNELALQRPYWRTLGYDVVIGDHGPELVELDEGGAKLFGTSKDGYVQVSSHEDLEAMQRAAERLQDRVYGRPKQVQEVSGPEGGPVRLEAPADARQKSRKAAELLRELGQLADDVDG